jgi:hypothetical protein
MSEDLYAFISTGLSDDRTIGNFIITERNKRSDDTKINIKIMGKKYLVFFDGFSMLPL